MRRHAFTIIELLVVCSIIALLAGLVLAGVSALGVGSKKQKSATIIEVLRQALEATAVQQGSYTSPAEHPLAGSYGTVGAPRFIFQRSTTAGGTILGDAAGTQQVALRGVALENLMAADRNRLLRDDDRYADGRVPLLYGVPRDFIGVLGAPVSGVTEFRRLPVPPDTIPVMIIADPDDAGLYPDNRYLTDSDKPPSASRQVIDYVFGSGTAKAELNKLGALYEPNETSGSVIAYGRAWSPEPADGTSGITQWLPGHMIDPEHPVFTGGPNAGKTRWVPYKLRGLTVYDAWGIEVLYSFKPTGGGARLLSAGPDGLFYWSPGHDGAFQTPGNATAFTGDDDDARPDNVQIVKGADL